VGVVVREDLQGLADGLDLLVPRLLTPRPLLVGEVLFMSQKPLFLKGSK
jgi:hypothetical protein